jgi:hypothetical protein
MGKCRKINVQMAAEHESYNPSNKKKCSDARNDAGFYPREAYGIPQNPPNQTILILKALTWDPPFQEPPIFFEFSGSLLH